MAVISGKSIMRSSAAVYLIGAAGVCAGQAPAGMYTPAILTNADRIAMDDDYPASAIHAGQHGSVRSRWTSIRLASRSVVPS